MFNEMPYLLRLFSWPRTLGVFLVVLFPGQYIVRSIVLDPVSMLHVELAFGILIGRGLLGSCAAWDRFRRAAEIAMGHREAVLSLLWRRTIAAARFTTALSMGCLYCLMRRPSPKPTMAGTAIHYMKNSQYGTMLAILMVSLFADIPVSAILVAAIEHDPERRHLFHLLMAILSAATLVFILGDRWYVKGDCHLIGDKMLHISIGKRIAVDLPVDRIAAIEPMRGSTAEWCKQAGQAVEDVVHISPANIADKPNVCLTISDGALMRMRRNQFECGLPKYVLMYVDEPHTLIRALHARGAIAPA